MPTPRLNAEHIAAIHAAMEMAEGSEAAAVEFLGWEGWDREALHAAIRSNDVLRERWERRGEPVNNAVTLPDANSGAIDRPDLECEVDSSVEALQRQEQRFRERLAAMGSEPSAIDFMVAASDLQSNHALLTLNAVTGGLVKTHQEIRKAREGALEEIKKLNFANPGGVEREDTLRSFYIQATNCELQLVDRLHKAFFLQMEARKGKGSNKKTSRARLGITALAGSTVAVQMRGDQ